MRRLRQADVNGAASFEQVHIAEGLPDDFECGGGVEDGLQADPREDASVMKAFQCREPISGERRAALPFQTERFIETSESWRF